MLLCALEFRLSTGSLELIKNYFFTLGELRFVQAFQSRNNRQDKLPSSPSKLSPSYSTPETSSFGTPEPSTPKSNDVTLRPTPLQTATKQLKEKIASLENDLNRIQEKHSGLEEERPYICCAPSRNSSLTSRAIFKKDGNTNPKWRVPNHLRKSLLNDSGGLSWAKMDYRFKLSRERWKKLTLWLMYGDINLDWTEYMKYWFCYNLQLR